MQRYQIIETVGAGGMGTVYRAVDRLTGDTVALKVVERLQGVALSLATEATVLHSLAHEFSVLAGLRHPYIISVLDYGFDPQRRPFVALEWLPDAQTIVQAARAADFATRLRLLIQLLQALSYLHRRGILHRDLKPGNVLVVDGTVRVVDFGLAVPGASTGEFVGTAAYMPPEMLREQRYLAASDLYAVGMIIVEVFTGRTPFAHGDVLAILNQPPDLTGLDNERLRAVCARLLAKAPADRYSDAADVVAALAAIANMPAIDQPPVRASYFQAAPFVGRQAELDRLTAALDATVNAGRGQALLVGGESGIGKSRLLEELRIRALTAGAVVLRGQCAPVSDLPYQLWQAPLAHLAVMTEPTKLEASVLETFLRGEQAATDAAPGAASRFQGEVEQRLTYVLVSLIRRLAQPVLLVLEDVQWADESLAVLRRLSRLVSALPLLVVASYRSDEAAALPEQLSDLPVMQLERLAPAAIQQLSQAMLGSAGSDPGLVRRLQAESDGNTFFLVETLRYVIEEVGPPRVGEPVVLPDVLLPRGVVEVIQQRLDYVPSWAQPALRLAAVAGQEIDPRLLEQAADPPFDLPRWLYACADAAVLENRDNRWRFSHDKLRKVLLAMLPPTELAALHRRLAQAIEAVYPQDAAQARRLAEHWRIAGDVERALHYAVIAGQQLRRIGAYTDLRNLAERSLELLPPEGALAGDDEVRMTLWNYLGDAYRYRDSDKAQAAYETAIALADRRERESAKTHALHGLAVIYRDRGDTVRSEQMIDDLLTLGQAAHDPRALLPALSLKARALLLRGDYRQAETHYQRALAIAQELRDAIPIATMLMNLGAVACMQGHFEAGQQYFSTAEQTAQAAGAVDIVVYCLLNVANLASDQGDFATAEASFARCIPMIEELGEYSLLAGAYYDHGDLVLRQGRLAEAETWYEKTGKLAEQLHNYRWLTNSLHGLGKVAYLRADYRAAQRHIRASQAHAEALNLVPDQVLNLSYLTRIHLKLGEQDAARAALRAGLQTVQALDASPPQLDILPAAIEWKLFFEQPEEAAELLVLARHHPEAAPVSYAVLDDLHSQLLRELAPAELAAALDRGRQRDLVATLAQLLAECGPA
ncbi:MAG: AAA family ATPase [Chloroflexi bacterium]|nr:AAA family ATPase [Chloroflexota bacterium]